MKAIKVAGIGEGDTLRLQEVAKQFNHWRQSRVRGERIPATLWGQAVHLCQDHTPQRVAGVLRVALAGLMRRLQRASDGAAQRPTRNTEFVELIMPTAKPELDASKLRLAPTPELQSSAATGMPAHECVLELENACGAKMRVQLNGAGLANLGALCSTFWSAR